MAKARALDKRRKSIRNIRKITRTMELIATARFKKAMDRALAATAYTQRITDVVRSLARSGLKVQHPLLDPRPEVRHAKVLVLTANRGLCGGYNGGVLRLAFARIAELPGQLRTDLETAKKADSANVRVSVEVSGKRGIAGFKFRHVEVDERFTQFEDQPKFADVDAIASRFLNQYALGELDRLDVVYTRFASSSKQIATVETILPLASVGGDGADDRDGPNRAAVDYEFLPSAESILEEVVPTSFKVKLFKCFLDAAVSEQIARMVAMKSATENASDIIKMLSRTYNRARQSQITNEIMEVIGGAEALNG
ncbi:MAG: ATP synthase F1 subunit gamma [Planctomycetes bacterium]|nr:ATP synthase F1 subunit gamma [Planctomycetota bacterium]